MTAPSLPPRWLGFADAAALQTAAVEAIAEAAETALRLRGRFDIVLAGGTTPKAIYAACRSLITDWSRWHCYFGDERCLPIDDPRTQLGHGARRLARSRADSHRADSRHPRRTRRHRRRRRLCANPEAASAASTSFSSASAKMATRPASSRAIPGAKPPTRPMRCRSSTPRSRPPNASR